MMWPPVTRTTSRTSSLRSARPPVPRRRRSATVFGPDCRHRLPGVPYLNQSRDLAVHLGHPHGRCAGPLDQHPQQLAGRPLDRSPRTLDFVFHARPAA